MDIGLAYFSGDGERPDPYGLFLKTAKLADELGLSSVWIPERHFNPFGGAFPCPAVAAAAIATITRRINIRAGSVILPLHDSIEIAEQWAMVNGFAEGRVGLAFGSGWLQRDFVIKPSRFAARKEVMWRQIEEVRTLLRGGSAQRTDPDGAQNNVTIFPRLGNELHPMWVATMGDPKTVQRAGANDLGILTHLVNQSPARLKQTIALYRKSLPPGASGHVTLMVHTYIANNDELARLQARASLKAYLRQFLSLAEPPKKMEDDARIDQRLEFGVISFLKERSLIGGPETCQRFLETLESMGVDEIACLIDFGIPEAHVIESMMKLPNLKAIAARA